MCCRFESPPLTHIHPFCKEDDGDDDDYPGANTLSSKLTRSQPLSPSPNGRCLWLNYGISYDGSKKSRETSYRYRAAVEWKVSFNKRIKDVDRLLLFSFFLCHTLPTSRNSLPASHMLSIVAIDFNWKACGRSVQILGIMKWKTPVIIKAQVVFWTVNTFPICLTSFFR